MKNEGEIKDGLGSTQKKDALLLVIIFFFVLLFSFVSISFSDIQKPN